MAGTSWERGAGGRTKVGRQPRGLRCSRPLRRVVHTAGGCRRTERSPYEGPLPRSAAWRAREDRRQPSNGVQQRQFPSFSMSCPLTGGECRSLARSGAHPGQQRAVRAVNRPDVPRRYGRSLERLHRWFREYPREVAQGQLPLSSRSPRCMHELRTSRGRPRSGLRSGPAAISSSPSSIRHDPACSSSPHGSPAVRNRPAITATKAKMATSHHSASPLPRSGSSPVRPSIHCGQTAVVIARRAVTTPSATSALTFPKPNHILSEINA